MGTTALRWGTLPYVKGIGNENFDGTTRLIRDPFAEGEIIAMNSCQKSTSKSCVDLCHCTNTIAQATPTYTHMYNLLQLLPLLNKEPEITMVPAAETLWIIHQHVSEQQC